jgi:hypothetical protein
MSAIADKDWPPRCSLLCTTTRKTPSQQVHRSIVSTVPISYTTAVVLSSRKGKAFLRIFAPKFLEILVRFTSTGVFVTPGLFNHSCAPTLRFAITGTKMTLSTMRNVGAGEELCHSYLQTCEADLFEPVGNCMVLGEAGHF